MRTAQEQKVSLGPPAARIPLLCPENRRPLWERDGEVVCLDERGEPLRSWPRRGGFLDLVVGDRFEDASDEACRRYETESNTHSTRHYWIPLFQRLFPDWRQRPPRLLAIGCGIGVEVDLLCDAGFVCFGIDNGNRTVDWAKRRHREGLVMANGMALPFVDGTFDAVFCGCVFPHVGVVGDSARVSPQCEAHRQRLAGEMVRVARPGGHVIACCPNRRFPFDIFHGRKPGSYQPRFNPPWNRSLLSVSDFRRFFTQAGARRVETLPIDGFWGFVTMRRSWKGRCLSWPVRVAFRAASVPALSFLRSTPLIPWITVHCTV